MKKHRFRALFFLFVSLFFVCLLTLACMPMLFSSQIGQKILLSYVNKNVPGRVSIQDLSLSWLHKQKISSLQYEDKKNGITVTCKEIESDASLLSMIKAPHDFGNIKVMQPTISLQKELISWVGKSEPKLQKASLVVLPEIRPSLLPSSFIGSVTINQGILEITSPQLPPIRFQNINSQISSAKDPVQVNATLCADTIQQGISGQIFLESFVRKKNTENTELKSQIRLSHFPIAAIDQVLQVVTPQYAGFIGEMVGSSLDMVFNFNVSPSDLKADLSISSDHVQASFNTEKVDQTITMGSPGYLKANFSPALFGRLIPLFPSLQGSTLTSPVAINLNLKKLSIPFSEKTLNIENTAFETELSISPIQIEKEKKPFLSTSFKGKLSSSGISSEVETSITMVMNAQPQVLIEAKAEHPLSSSWDLSSTVTLDALSTSMIDLWFSKEGLYSSFLGDKIKGTVNIKANPTSISASALVSSPNFISSSLNLVSQNETITLQSPVTLTYKVLPSFANPLLGSFCLKEPAEIKATLSSLSVPKDLEKLILQADISSSPLVLSLHGTANEIGSFTSKVDVNTLSQIALSLKTDNGRTDLKGAFDLGKKSFILKAPFTIEYVVTDPFLATLFSTPNRPYLMGNTPIRFIVQPTTFSSLSTLQLEADLSVDEMRFQNEEKTVQVSVKELSSKLQFNGKKSQLDIHTFGSIAPCNGPSGTLDLQVNISKFLWNNLWDSSQANIASNLRLQNFPLTWLDSCCGFTLPISPLLGSSLDVQADLTKTPSDQALSLSVQSPLLKIQGAIAIDKQKIYLIQKMPLQAEYTLTPQGYKALDKWLIPEKNSTPFSLVQNTSISIAFSELSIPFLADSSFPDLSQTFIQGTISTPGLTFEEKTSERLLSFKRTSLNFNKGSPKDPLDIQMQTSAEVGSIQKSSQPTQQGSIQLSAKFNDLFNTEGKLDFSHLYSEIHASVQKMPTAALDILTRFSSQGASPFPAMFGSYLNSNVDLKIQNAEGPFAINIYSPNTRMSVSGKLSQGAMTLTEKAYGQVTLTPAVSALLLKEVNPLSISSITSRHPITIEIDPQGFSLPVTSFSLNKLNIPSARLELGQIVCKNEGNVHLTLGLLKSQISKNKELELWFAPMDLHINQGKTDIERTEVLVSRTFDIALWGKLDLPGNSVNMVLGLTSQCLNKAFGIKNLPEDYVLQIPMTGKLDNVQLNTGMATAKIAALLAWQQKAIGGPAGAIFGEFLGRLATLPSNDSPTPPAKKPFPWEKETSSVEEPGVKYKRKAHITGNEKPLKQLLKILR